MGGCDMWLFMTIVMTSHFDIIFFSTRSTHRDIFFLKTEMNFTTNKRLPVLFELKVVVIVNVMAIVITSHFNFLNVNSSWMGFLPFFLNYQSNY